MRLKSQLIHTAKIKERATYQQLSVVDGTVAILIEGAVIYGQTSEASATIHRVVITTELDGVFQGKLILKDVNGTFSEGESILAGTPYAANGTTGTIAPLLSGTRQPVKYWQDGAEIKCRFYEPDSKKMTNDVGMDDFESPLPELMVFPDVAIYPNVTVIETEELGFAGLYDVISMMPMYSKRELRHYECKLKRRVS
jgi:hypothetical protein